MGTDRSFRRGQAFMEMALGMFAFALVLAALFGCADYILCSLEMQRTLRAEAGRSALVSSSWISSNGICPHANAFTSSLSRGRFSPGASRPIACRPHRRWG